MNITTLAHLKRLSAKIMSLSISCCLAIASLAAAEFSLSDDKPLFGDQQASHETVAKEELANATGPRSKIGVFGGNVQSGVSGELFISHLNEAAGTATLIARYTPPDGYYLYSKSLPMAGIKGVGRPTLLEIADNQPKLSRGPALATQRATDKQSQGGIYPLYPKGPVEIHLPIHLPQGPSGTKQATRIWLTYMTCNEDFCLRPVEREEVIINLPQSPTGMAGTWETSSTDNSATQDAPSTETATTSEMGDLQVGTWYYPQNVTELTAIMDAAEAQGLPAFLDFTGPSCLNCQIMKQTIYVLPSVQEAFSSLVLISINTDPPHADLGDFQLATYGTFTRPFYVRTNPQTDWLGEAGQSWSTFFRPGNSAELARFTGFLAGEDGDAAVNGEGTPNSIEQSGGWGGFLLLAILGGLFTLVMPCTYPMIPLTINFFTKQGENGKSTWPLAATYAMGIIGFFVLVGLLFALIMGDNPAYFAGHWLTNLIIGLIFLLLGASLIGLFFLRLPSGLMTLGGSRSGYGGALLMGLAFAVMSFTCTAPFAGLVLGSAALSGSWATAVIGMGVYASVIALPFFFLALAPKLLNRLPGAGAWMNEFKVVGGLVEIAASLKFLYMTDYYFGWGLIDRTTVLAAWSCIGLAIALYILGFIRLKGDSPIPAISPSRLILALIFAVLAFVFIAGLSGTHLGSIEGLFPQKIS